MRKMTAFVSMMTAFALMAAPVYAAEAESAVSEAEAVVSEAEAAVSEAEAAVSEAAVSEEAAPEAADGEALSLYVLAGPTGIGAMNLWASSDAGETSQPYKITMTGANDEVIAALSNGDADVAAIATNLAATLYNKTEGGISVLAVNTLGVLSILENGDSIASVKDLAGKTIYAPGQGANPEYILRYVLSGNGLDPDKDVTIEFVAEGSELLNVWETAPDAVIMAPQPVATTLLMQNEGAKKALDMTEEWDAVSGGDSTLMMGCVVARDDYIEEHPDAIAAFLKDYQVSIGTALGNIAGTAELCEKYGLIPKAPLAQKAIPECGLTYVDGEDMKTQLAGYLSVMFDANPKSVGGALPADDFYYVA